MPLLGRLSKFRSSFEPGLGGQAAARSKSAKRRPGRAVRRSGLEHLRNMCRAYLLGLKSWWCRRRGPALAHLHFVFYTRRGCHLCEVAWERIQAAQQRHQFTLEEVDVDLRPELAAQYGSAVPVIAINGKVRFRGAVNLVLLNRLLHAEEGNAGKGLDKRIPPGRP